MVEHAASQYQVEQQWSQQTPGKRYDTQLSEGTMTCHRNSATLGPDPMPLIMASFITLCKKHEYANMSNRHGQLARAKPKLTIFH